MRIKKESIMSNSINQKPPQMNKGEIKESTKLQESKIPLNNALKCKWP
jgi:hypothetical protein